MHRAPVSIKISKGLAAVGYHCLMITGRGRTLQLSTVVYQPQGWRKWNKQMMLKAPNKRLERMERAGGGRMLTKAKSINIFISLVLAQA